MIAIFAALSAALAVGAGAFGAHGASSPDAAEWLKTGGLYQLIHAVAALTIMSFARGPAVLLLVGGAIFRSEERRGGKECVSTCRYRWSPYHEKKKKTKQ